MTRYTTSFHYLAAALMLACAGPVMAVPPPLAPGQPVDFRGPLGLRENSDGSVELGVWLNPGSRSRAFRPLNVPPREFRKYPCPVEYQDPYEAPQGYYDTAPVVRIQGVGSTRVADNGWERFVDVHHVSSHAPVVPQADCPAFANLATPPSAKPMADLHGLLLEAGTSLEGDDEQRKVDRFSISRLLRRGLSEKLSDLLGH